MGFVFFLSNKEIIFFLSITINFALEKFFFEPRVHWMKKAKSPWQIENVRIKLEKKISLLEIKEVDTQNYFEFFVFDNFYFKMKEIGRRIT